MKTTIISKNFGTQTIDTDTFNPYLVSSSSTIFKVIETIFNRWFEYSTQDGAPMAKDIEGMYYGEADQPAIYNKRGAIIGGIENFIEEVIDRGLHVVNTKQICQMDIEAAFE